MGGFKDLTGEKFGYLTVRCRGLDYISPKGYKSTTWVCDCACGNTTTVRGCSLKSGLTLSCGCYQKEQFAKYTPQTMDLTGLRFGKLLVKSRIIGGDVKNPQWLCQCDCGNIKEICGYYLTSKTHPTLSCGCLVKENGIKANKKYNDYVIMDNYIIMYTAKNEPFFVDIEDFGRVRNICWSKSADGYLVGKDCGKIVRLHDIIMNCPKNKVVDHIKGEATKHDNRKSNLRIATPLQNSQNRKIYSNNTSGVTGVCFSKETRKWVAYITVNKKRLYLGRFEKYDDAVNKRLDAEHKYFGEWSYNASQGK